MMPDGRTVIRYELSNSNGIKVCVLNYAGILQSILVPDRNGVIGDIILGFDHLKDYLADSSSHGALVGRYANRIAGAQIKLDDVEYKLDMNDGENCLHGGREGFQKVLWNSQIIKLENDEILRLSHISPHGDQGFPGRLEVIADYSLNNNNTLSIQLLAITDQTTVVSLTMHPYFNLSGDSERQILDHNLRINSNKYLPVSSKKIPLGEMRGVGNSPFDFRENHSIGAFINTDDAQLKIANGYDHCYVLSDTEDEHEGCAILSDPISGREMVVSSNAPGMQLYTGNHLNSDFQGKGGRNFVKQGGVCLEPQAFPNAPNEPCFPSAEIGPGERYEHNISYRFSTRD